MAAKPTHVCHACPFHEFRKHESRTVCLATDAQNNIVHQARLGCPHGLHDHPLPPHDLPPVELTIGGGTPDPIIQAFRAVWNTIHRRPGTLAPDFDRDAERRWLAFLPLALPKECGCKPTPQTAELAAKIGAARAWWVWALEQFSIDLTSLRTYHDSLVRIHNAKNEELDKPPLTPAHAARIHGCAHLFTAEEIAADVEERGPIGVYLNADWGMGDAVCLTASIRDIQAAWPGEYEFFLRTPYAEVFANLPGVRVTTDAAAAGAPQIRYQITGPHHGELHLIDFLREKVGRIIGRRIPPGVQKPWLLLDDADRAAAPPLDRPYWIIACSHRVDITAKAWPIDNWQAVIDGSPDISFVRTGGDGKWDRHPPLSGIAKDLIGKTSIRELIQIIAHPLCIGAIGYESSAMHVAAAFGKRMICIAGDRMLPQSVRYVGQDYFAGGGCPSAGCVSYRVTPLSIKGDPWENHDRRLCQHPDPQRPQHTACITSIKPAEVIRAARSESCPIGH